MATERATWRSLRQPQPYRDCRKFEGCSVNICPLDPDRDARTFCRDDPETICKLPKAEQREIAAEYPPELLPWLAPRMPAMDKGASFGAGNSIASEGKTAGTGLDKGGGA
jgi:hypothetical protein